MFDIVATVLAYFYDLTHSYGGAIILLTSAIMVLLTPLTLKGTRSMIAMQRLQPEMKKLQNRYKDDRQKLNEEMLKFYKEHNINPVGGCLPLLIQMPVFFVLYQVLIGLTRRAPYGDSMGRAFGLAGTDPDAVFSRFGTFQPKHIEGTEMFRDLSQVSEMKSFGLDLSDTASNVMSQGVGKALPYLILIALIGATAWFQQKQIQGRNPQAQVNPQQQMIMKVMPFFLPVFSFALPAGVTIYFLVSNLYRIGQQAFITRTMYGDGAGHALPIDTTSTEAPEPKPGILAQLRGLGDGGVRSAAAKAGAAKSKPTSSTGRARKDPRPKPSSGPVSKATAAKELTGKGGGAKKPVGNPRRAAKAAGRAAATTAPSPNGEGNGRPEGNGAEAGATPSVTRAKTTAAPSRRAPAPNPNRSRTKKKRK
ncbi:MAG: membrane protein insertase YidC [Acidimicrobiales bacterium]